MSFLYPAFLLGALAIALPIALHLLRREVAPEVPFSAVRLLRRSPIERTRRRRLRDLVLLAARVAALALLAAAFARPYFASASAVPTLRIVAIDRSFSMGAPGRFAHALRLAGTAVDEASGGERVAVVAFDDRAEVIAPPGSRADAHAALASLASTQAGRFGATRFAPVVGKAVEIAAANPATVVVVSDLQRNGWEDEQPIAVPSTLQVEVRDAGVPPPNAAVVEVRVDADWIVGTVSNNSSAPYAGTVRVAVDGREVASAPVRIAAGETAEIALPHKAAARGTLRLSIDDAKGYPADDSRYVVLDPPSRTRVMIVTTAGTPQSGMYFARALEAAEQAAFDVKVVSAAEVSAMSLKEEETSRLAVIVLLSTRGLDRRGRDLLSAFAESGGGVLIAAGTDVDASLLASAMNWPDFAPRDQTEALALSASDVRHPIFRPFGAFAANLGQIRFDRIWKLDARGWEVAARFTDGSPALVERPVGGGGSSTTAGRGRAMVFASDLDRRWNEFPLHPAFVPFAVEAVRHVAGSRERGRDYLIADAPQGSGPAPGVYTLKDGRRVAVNVDARESAGARLTPQEFAAMIVPAPAAEGSAGQQALRAQTVEARQNLWQYGLVLMLAVLAVESVVGRT